MRFHPVRHGAALSFFQFPLGNPEKPLVPYQVFPNAKSGCRYFFSLMQFVSAEKYNENHLSFFRKNKQFPETGPTENTVKTDPWIGERLLE